MFHSGNKNADRNELRAETGVNVFTSSVGVLFLMCYIFFKGVNVIIFHKPLKPLGIEEKENFTI